MGRAEVAAWAVHVYTASGAVLGLLALEAISRSAYGAAFAWMALATWIDSTDGALARRFRVKEVLPSFDGARLDDIVDYLNYVVVPLVLAIAAGLLPSGNVGLVIAAVPLLASAYGFCQLEAKTADHFFTGFPSYWNIVVLYLYALRTPLTFNVAILLGFSVMVFVPIRYLYPSRSPVARRRTYVLGGVWALLLVILLWQFPNPSRALAAISLFFPAYYLAMSFHIHFNHPRNDRPES
jgi:phosphatidylcholine synthase